MNMNRRNFLELTAGAGALGFASGCGSTTDTSQATRSGPTTEELDKAAAALVLQLEGITSPVIIESIKLLRKDRD